MLAPRYAIGDIVHSIWRDDLGTIIDIIYSGPDHAYHVQWDESGRTVSGEMDIYLYTGE